MLRIGLGMKTPWLGLGEDLTDICLATINQAENVLNSRP